MVTDKASGKLAHRPEWDRLLELLVPGDEMVITRLDRAGRSRNRRAYRASCSLTVVA